MSDWARTQLRSAETFIGRARRETFDCRLKFKREIESDVRDYLGNMGSQLSRIRDRVTAAEGELWPAGEGARMKELRAQLVGENENVKGRCREEGKGSEKKEKDCGYGNLGKCQGKRLIIEEKETNVEKKPEEKGGVDVVKGEEEWRGKPYRAEDGFWRVPINNDEWAERREKETYRCKEGGWWTKTPEERYMAWQFLRDLKGW